MRILVLKMPHDNDPKQTWMVAYVLPFAPIAATNFGAGGDFISLGLTVPKTAREKQAQDIFRAHVATIAKDMKKPVYETYHSAEDIVATGHRGMSMVWVTDHTKERET
jgi:hypothetical protein